MSVTGRVGRTRPLASAVIALVVLVPFAGSCSDDGGTAASTTTEANGNGGTTSADPADPTTTSALPATQPTDSAGNPDHQAIVDAYVGFWDARDAANIGTPNPQDPALAQFATGAQLEWVVQETQKNLDGGLAFQLAAEPENFRRVVVVSVDGDLAEVQECVVDDGLIVERATGTVVDGGVATQNVQGTLRFVDGAWRVSGSELIQEWEGVAGCALAS